MSKYFRIVGVLGFIGYIGYTIFDLIVIIKTRAAFESPTYKLEIFKFCLWVIFGPAVPLLFIYVAKLMDDFYSSAYIYNNPRRRKIDSETPFTKQVREKEEAEILKNEFVSTGSQLNVIFKKAYVNRIKAIEMPVGTSATLIGVEDHNGKILVEIRGNETELIIPLEYIKSV